ncbi:DnaD domain-containing protein [Lentibacillus jeotgali]|uniref:DnaD domain-containing protein n=1 Tax=Lentibacillus jeotgali TaxID=558169 RepID=UPI0002626FF2|nr:DnaD domain protein [Lentibacillus jeotgali]
MAKYRQVHIDFWQDGFVLDLTPEEKYFYLYLMTNSKTTQCGIYELPKRIIETETGYNRETVDKLLDRFKEYGKILYNESTREIMLVNWIKYNWINSKKVLSLINKELNDVKNHEFIRIFLQKCKEYGHRIDTLSITYKNGMDEKNEKTHNDAGLIPYEYPMDSLSIDLVEEREEEIEREGEIEKEQQQQTSAIIQFWDGNGFGLNNIQGKNQLLSWLDDSSFKQPEKVIRKAMEIACANNKRQLNYIEGILRNWENQSLLTLEEIEYSKKEHKKQAATNDGYNYGF